MASNLKLFSCNGINDTLRDSISNELFGFQLPWLSDSMGICFCTVRSNDQHQWCLAKAGHDQIVFGIGPWLSEVSSIHQALAFIHIIPHFKSNWLYKITNERVNTPTHRMKGQSEIAYLPKFADLYVKPKRISDIQSNFMHLELLIASLAQILTELLQFKVLTYL